jgi:predicted amidohydrolase YtcJ
VLRSDHVKIMIDGVVANFTAALAHPYLDGHGHATGNLGLTFVDPAGRPGPAPPPARPLQFVAAQDVPRFARLGAIANPRTLWAALDEGDLGN